MKKLIALILAVAMAYTAPVEKAHADTLEDLFKIGIGVAIGLTVAYIVSESMDENASLGVSVEFNNDDGSHGYFQYVGEGMGRGDRFKRQRCREFDIVYTDICGNPTGVVETRVECKNRYTRRWEVVRSGDYSRSTVYQGQRRGRHPHGQSINPSCNFDDETEVMDDWEDRPGFMPDDRFTQDNIPPMLQMEPNDPPTIVPVRPPAVIPMDQQPPGIVPMGNDPVFMFPSNGTN